MHYALPASELLWSLSCPLAWKCMCVRQEALLCKFMAPSYELRRESRTPICRRLLLAGAMQEAPRADIIRGLPDHTWAI